LPEPSRDKGIKRERENLMKRISQVKISSFLGYCYLSLRRRLSIEKKKLILI